jgi:hypothetical protein
MLKKIPFFIIAMAFVFSPLFAGENKEQEKKAPVETEKKDIAPPAVKPEPKEEIKEEKSSMEAEKPATETEKESKLEATEKAENSLIVTIKEIFGIIDKNYPALIKKLNDEEDEREELLEDFVRSFDAGIKLVKTDKIDKIDKDKKPLKETKKEKYCFPIVNIASNKISYFRIDEFNGKVFEPFKEDCEMVAALSKPPVGIVIDLRNCSGNNYKDALKCLYLVCKDKSLPELPGKEKIKRSFNLPIAVLIGENTSRAAEVFVYWIAKAKQGLTIGESSAGTPFPEKRFDLKSGERALLIPDIPDFLAGMVVENSKASIDVPAYPQIPYKQISEESQSEKKDKCLLRAIDLLISLNALETQWKK